MTWVTPEFEEDMQHIQSVSVDANFLSTQFPKYKLGPDNQILEDIKEDSRGRLTLKEVVLQEKNQLTEQHKCLSVRDLVRKFDKNLAAATKLPDEVLNWYSSRFEILLIFKVLTFDENNHKNFSFFFVEFRLNLGRWLP